MRILAGWDDEPEAELIAMYLAIDDANTVTVTNTPEAFRGQIESGDPFDIILMSIELPDVESAYELFELAKRNHLNSPIVGACSSSDVFRVVKFMANGMSAYVIRDSGGDYVFMLQSILKSTVEAVLAAREQQLVQRLREEVESVRKLQASVIPEEVEAPEGYRICGRYEPSQIRILGGHPVTMAGGDYYDVFTLSDDNIVMLVGDASGHGMKACMSIMTMHTLVRMIRTQRYKNTANFVEEMNRQLCAQSIVNDEGGFITLLYAILNVKTRELQWTSAGHPPPLVQHLETNVVEPLAGIEAGGLPLAVFDGAEYETYTNILPEDCRLLLFTDGLEEAFPDTANDEPHTQFGVNGIMQSITNTINQPLDEALQTLFDDSNAFTQGSGRHDDTSCVFLERRENTVAPKSQQLETQVATN
jgi:serine phosphatase RsbU (regulator of sigma subunit)